MKSLPEFLSVLRREGELVEVDASVDADLELAEIHRRVVACGGPALLFKGVKGADFPCVTNLFGTDRRVELAFGPRPENFLRQVVELAHELPSLSVGKLWGHRNLARQGLRVGLKSVSNGPVMECRQDPVDLGRLPLTKSWPQDGGSFFTLGLVYTEHPITGHHNLGLYRLQRHDAQTTGVHWQIQKGGGFHHYEAERRDQALPLTVFLGGPPALIMAAIAPLPENVPELILASLLQGERMRRVRNPGGSHPLIAEADFALHGTVPPHVRRPEGPFGDHYGYYSLKHDYPVLEVSSIHHRRNAVLPATVVGKPPQEDLYLGNYIQRLMAPLSRLVMPSIEAIWSYGETGYHCLSSIVVSERYPREAMKFAFRILGEDGGQLALTKFLVIVDGSVDLADFRQVMEHVLKRIHFETDLFIFANLAMDSLDYSGPAVNEGSKGILIGVGEPCRQLPRAFSASPPGGARRIEAYCGGCLVVEGPAYEQDREYPQHLATDKAVADWPLIFLVDDASIVDSNVRFLWTTFTRFEPAADIYAAATRTHRHHECLTAPVVIDCRMKPGYPDELVTDDEILQRVTRRWGEYFPDGNVDGVEDAMGYSGFKRLS